MHSMMHSIAPALDPHTQRAAIDALEAQRAAYHRFARQAEAQQGPLGRGELDQVATFTDGVSDTVGELHEGAHAAKVLYDHAVGQASETDLQDLERRMAEMMREARNAEVAIHNLTTQLEAWRDAYGRQLSELGVTPGSSSSGGTSEVGAPTARGYGQRLLVRAPRILDRKG